MGELNKKNAKFQRLYWLVIAALIILTGSLISWKFVWVIGIAAGVLSSPIVRVVQSRNYKQVIAKKVNSFGINFARFACGKLENTEEFPIP